MGLSPAIKEKLQLRLNKAIAKRAQEIYGECAELSEFAIEQFYSAYSPKKYNRMYAFEYVCSPFINKVSQTEYRVGIRVLEGVAGGHKDPDEYVFHGVMEMGVHGTSHIATSTPPMTVIRNYFSQFG